MATLTTPIYGFPYPDGTERVADGDNAIGALAAAVDAALANAARPSAVRMERSGADQTITAGALTTVVYNTIVREDDEAGDFSAVTTTGIITVNRAGWYEVSAGVSWAGTSNSGRRELYLRNGAIGIAGQAMEAFASGAADLLMSAAAVVYLDVGATLQAVVRETGVNLPVLAQPYSHLAAARIR